MDKSWINYPRNSDIYRFGLEQFLDFATSHAICNGKIICPCVKCKYKKWHPREVVHQHLLAKPFPVDYTLWSCHGERSNMSYGNFAPQSSQMGVHIEHEDDSINVAVRDAFGFQDDNFHTEVEGSEPIFFSNEASRDFIRLMDDADHPLYPGCKNYSKLSFLIKLYHIKCMCGITDKAMSMIFDLLKDAFPDADIPLSFYEAKKSINRLGLNYKKIAVCPNDCMLYWGDDADREFCKKCNTSKYRSISKGKRQKKRPAKILRHFPLNHVCKDFLCVLKYLSI